MKYIINFFITGFLIMFFQWIGWIKIVQDVAPFPNYPFLNQLLVAGIIGLIFTIGLWLAQLVFILVVMGTCGFGCILLPVYYLILGPAGFWAVTKILPNWVNIHATTWQIVIMGLLITFVRIQERVSNTSTISTSSSSS
jgi:hypothetical protein